MRVTVDGLKEMHRSVHNNVAPRCPCKVGWIHCGLSVRALPGTKTKEDSDYVQQHGCGIDMN